MRRVSGGVLGWVAMDDAPGRSVGVAVAVGAALVLGAAPVAATEQSDGWTTTQYGPLGPADRDLLIKVRLAGLWERPAGDKAQQRAVNPKVKEIGAKISAEHTRWTRQPAPPPVKLGVELPSEPAGDQRVWLKEMDDAEGAEFDRIFIDRLRAAHGKVFAVIASYAPAPATKSSDRSRPSPTPRSCGTWGTWRAAVWSTGRPCPIRRTRSTPRT